MRRLLKWLGLGLLSVLLLIAMLAGWLLGSESGARFALARAIGATDGKLSVERSHGRLVGPLTLEGVRWNDAQGGVDARIAKLRIDLKPLPLLALRVQVTALDVDDVEVALSTRPPEATPAPAPVSPPSLAAPIDITLDRLSVRHARIARDGQPVFALDQLDLGAQWTRQQATIRSLALRAPDGQLDLHATLAAAAGHAGNGAATFRWRLGEVDYAGTLKAQGDGQRASLAVTLDAPVPATLDATLTQSASLPWTLKLNVPRFDPKRVQKTSTLSSLALTLEGGGDRGSGRLGGHAVINDHAVQLDALRYAFDGHALKLETLNLKSPEAAGMLHASGALQLDAQPPTLQADLQWQGVEIPADLAGQALATHGKLSARGSAEQFHAEGTLALGPPGQLADLTLDLDGTPQAITLKQLALKQARGGLDAHGTLTLKPALGWDMTAKASQFDPGAFVAQWPGALDFELASQGTLTEHGPEATLRLAHLSGTLRKQAVSGQADLHAKPGHLVDGTLMLASGRSRIDISGTAGLTGSSDATIQLAVASLGDWLPDAHGRLDGQIHIRGQWPALAIDSRLHGADFAHDGTQLATLDLDAQLASLDPPQGRLALQLGKLKAGALAFDSLRVAAQGDRAAHQLEVTARGTPLGFRLALDGSAKDSGAWNGRLRDFDIDLDQAPPLHLQQPAALSWNAGAFNVDETCLSADDANLCASASGLADGSLDARYRLARWPLALFARLASPEAAFKLDGLLDGQGRVHRDSRGQLDGQIRLESATGSLAQSEPGQAPLLAWRDFSVDATLSPQATQARVHAALDHDGLLDGEVTLSGAADAPRALSGRVDLALNRLDFVAQLSREVANVQGRVTAHYTVAGTSSAPELTGALKLQDFAAELPSAGIKLQNGNLAVRAVDAEHFALEGSLQSGQGTLTLAGTGGVTADAPLQASIKGERFLAADIPAARVVISPDLRIDRDQRTLRVSGSVSIPETDLNLAKLPGGGVNQSSPDLVIVDAEQAAPGPALPLTAALDIKLGDAVKLAGLGLDGRVSGQLRIDQRPGRTPVGTGTLNAEGTYKAYGQNLTIETGRLLFAGTSLDNPGLDIRAVRKISSASGGAFDEGIVAGLQVRGTALAPQLTVFSKPVMEQSEALSYLLTGKPLSSLKSGEGDMLGSAARALGSATGDLLAKGIGARLGVDAGVSDNAALGGAAFTVGKYLSPKLYLSYGVGLFTPGEVVSLKYFFNRRFNFEAQNATTGSRAGLNYRYER